MYYLVRNDNHVDQLAELREQAILLSFFLRFCYLFVDSVAPINLIRSRVRAQLHFSARSPFMVCLDTYSCFMRTTCRSAAGCARPFPSVHLAAEGNTLDAFG